MNVPCHDIADLMDAFLDGTLSRKERSRVKKHLKTCASCKTEWAEQREVEKILSGLPRLRCPQEVTQKIESLTVGTERVSLLDRLLMMGESWGWRWVPVGLAATAIILVFVLHPLLDQKEPVPYTQEEVMKAKNQVKWSLGYIAKTMNQTEREVVENVLFKDIPKTVRKSIKKAVPIFQGGQ